MTFQLAIEIFVIINFVVIGLSHLLCSQTWVEYFAWLHSRGRLGSFLNGFPTLMMGSLIVAFHAAATGWSIAITVLGWLMIGKAVMCFVFPDWGLRSMSLVQKSGKKKLMVGGVIMLLVAGLLGLSVRNQLMGPGMKGNSANAVASQFPLADDSGKLNGIFLVERWNENAADLQPLGDGEVLLKHEPGKFIADDDSEAVSVVVQAIGAIPFHLARDPWSVPQDDGRLLAMAKFDDDVATQMENFSKKYLGRQVAVVLGGEIVTMHKVRSIIKNGELMISRCTDDGCRVILSRLGEMSKEQTGK